MMRKAGWGRVINIASAHGLTRLALQDAYVAAKHGIVGLDQGDGAGDGGKSRSPANAICPGYVLTPLVEAQIPDQMKTHDMDRETVIREVMLERQPSQASSPRSSRSAARRVFLCSDAADADHRHDDQRRRRLDGAS